MQKSHKIRFKQEQSPNKRAHRVLFDQDTPFRPKREDRKDTYQRHPKHRNKGDNDE